MHLTDGSGHANNAFVEEDAAAGRPASMVTADWLNAVQAEIAAVIAADGRTLDKANNAQMAAAVLSLIVKAGAGHTAAVNPHPQYMQQAQVQALIEARVGDYVIDSGTANALLVALNPAISSYTGQITCAVKVAATNTEAATLNAGGGARPLLRDDGTAMQAGDLMAGMVITVLYDSATDSFYVTEMVASQAQALQSASSQMMYFIGQI